MREILFRGKPKYKNDVEFVRPDLIKDDGFIYGSLVVSNGKYLICIFAVCSHKTFVDNTRATMIEVIPETVGQYTGLTDKNGKRIFEGDILKSRYDDEYPDNVAIEVVKWIYNGWHTQQGNCTPDTIDDVEIMPYSEVVGNVHDNPELLKGE